MGKIIEIIFIVILILLVLTNIYVYFITKKLQNQKNEKELSGFEIAKTISDKISSQEPHIIKKNGKFLDYYDNSRNVIKLSPEVFDGDDMYSSITSIIIASNIDNKNYHMIEKFNSFIIIASYLIIVIGAFLNNFNALNLGLILFIIAFFIEIISINNILNKDYNLLKDLNIINLEEFNKHKYSIILINLARIPYSFISNFR